MQKKVKSASGEFKEVGSLAGPGRATLKKNKDRAR
jgi:hypothetical protein